MCGILACGTMACCAGCSCCGSIIKKSTGTRVIYVIFFLLVSVISYILSAFASQWFASVDVLKICSKYDNECFGSLVVYRLTFSLAIYHILLGLALIGVKSSEDSRAAIQDGYWPVKIFFLAGLSFASFFIPNTFFVYYGWISLFGAALFILIQLILLIEFAYGINEIWVSKIEDEGHLTNRYYIMLLGSTIATICIALALTITMLVLWSKTSINQFFIVFNLGLSLIIGVLSINEKIREFRPSSGLFQSGVVMLYSAYLVFSAIMSEPSMDNNSNSGKQKTWTIIIGSMFTIISVCYSAFRASDSNEILGSSSGGGFDKLPTVASDDEAADDKMEDDESGGVAYNYTFFHITFALGAMYIGMLLTNWATISGTSGSNGDLNVDSGMVSVWVKIVSGWLVHLLYLWTLVAPVLMPNREWD
ncbi:TMS membrane protein [Heterostelium album PN500]|uniref:TMS membrane protein n=1 Tax=Heterostelium pallidum (strain ATCC 26659 / Pp 5 / PN500) TaxID=670386 RepID=D3BLM9_HETP5|nr:TMS membrane protein [Heterostelium album PN500]EFA77480.1 TMS membrane protein [Heterostelium album PN500]|eukprot:XP_020429608.1 TMS membrane protein [Heterostelium album PN500]